MPFLWTSAIKDLRRRLADPAALAMWIGIPLVIGGLMGFVFGGGGGGGVQPKAKLLLVDEDDSFVSRLLAGVAASGGEDSVLEVERVDADQGRARMEEGVASAMLTLPEGFGLALLEDEPTELHLLTNPAQRILPGIVRSGLEILVELVFYAQRLFGEQLRGMAQGPPPGDSFFADALIAMESAKVNAKLRGLEGVLFPPVLELETELAAKPEEEPAPGGIGVLLFPGTLLMALLFIAQGMSDDLWSEKDGGTLRRVLVTPNGMGSFLLGKLLAGVLFMSLATAVGLALGVFAFELPVRAVLPALGWCAVGGAALLSLFGFLQLLSASRQGANIVTTIVVFPLMMIGGSLFPMQMMPDWMIAVGRWTPNGLAVLRLGELLRGQAEWGLVARDGAILLGFGLVLFLLSWRRAAGRFLQS